MSAKDLVINVAKAMTVNKQPSQLPAMQAVFTLVGSRIVLDPSRHMV